MFLTIFFLNAFFIFRCLIKVCLVFQIISLFNPKYDKKKVDSIVKYSNKTKKTNSKNTKKLKKKYSFAYSVKRKNISIK